MKACIPILVAACCTVLFLAPFERFRVGCGKPGDPVSLGALAARNLASIPGSSLGSAARAIAETLVLSTLASAILLACEARWLPPSTDGARALLIAQALLTGMGMFVTLLIMMFNNTIIGFGGASSVTTPTPVFTAIVAVEATTCLTSLAAGISPHFGLWLHRLASV